MQKEFVDTIKDKIAVVKAKPPTAERGYDYAPTLNKPSSAKDTKAEVMRAKTKASTNKSLGYHEEGGVYDEDDDMFDDDGSFTEEAPMTDEDVREKFSGYHKRLGSSSFGRRHHQDRESAPGRSTHGRSGFRSANMDSGYMPRPGTLPPHDPRMDIRYMPPRGALPPPDRYQLPPLPPFGVPAGDRPAPGAPDRYQLPLLAPAGVPSGLYYDGSPVGAFGVYSGLSYEMPQIHPFGAPLPSGLSYELPPPPPFGVPTNLSPYNSFPVAAPHNHLMQYATLEQRTDESSEHFRKSMRQSQQVIEARKAALSKRHHIKPV